MPPPVRVCSIPCGRQVHFLVACSGISRPVSQYARCAGAATHGVALPSAPCIPWVEADDSPIAVVVAQLNEALPEDRILLRELVYPEGERGGLFVAVSKKSASDRILVVNALLAHCADAYMLNLGRRHDLTLRDELTRRTRVANLSEVAGPVIHEFNNFLYGLLLHLSVLEQELPEGMRAEVETLQRGQRDGRGHPLPPAISP